MSNPEEILIALISEVRNALVPARFHLQREQGAHAQRALAAVTRTLDFAAECAGKLDVHLSQGTDA